MKRFVFLEFLDPEIRSLLTQLKEIFTGKKSQSHIHITIRGPYPEPLPAELLEFTESRIRKDVLLISGIGLFNNNKSHVVYIKVHSRNLKRIWWKKDFPFNPHITLYEGEDAFLAKEIFHFLKREHIELVSHNFRVAEYASGQLEVFYEENDIPRVSVQKLVESENIKEDLLIRAQALVKAYRVNLDSENQHRGLIGS